MITFGIDIAKLSNNLAYLLISLGIDILAMGFIALGVRGVALEIWPYIICFIFVIVLVTVGHGVTFMFRIRSLNCANFVFDLVLSLIAIYYAAMLYRFEKLKPADYNVRHEQVNGDDEFTDVEFTGGLNMSIPDTRTGTECLFKSPTESKLTEITGTDISDGLTDGSKH